MTPPWKDLSNAYGSLCACGDLLTAHRTNAKSGKSPPSIADVATANATPAAAAAAVTTAVVVVVVATATVMAAAAAAVGMAVTTKTATTSGDGGCDGSDD